MSAAIRPQSEGVQTIPGVQTRTSAPYLVTPLGNVAKFTTTRRAWRLSLQAASGLLLPGERVAACGRRLISGSVTVWHVPGRSYGVVSGVQTCGSVWACAVCAAKVTERRRLELQGALDCWTDQGYRAVMVTYTLRHRAGESLGAVLGRLTAARGRMWFSGSAARFRARMGIVGSVRGLEVTYGANGWHPHVHELLFVQKDFVDGVGIERWIRDRWSHLTDSGTHGIDVRFADSEVAEYVAKYGRESNWDTASELTKQFAKVGRAGGWAPLGLLSAFMEEPTARAEEVLCSELWREFALTMKRRQQLVWSKGMRAAVGLGPVVSDEALAEAVEEHAVAMAVLSGPEWLVIVGNDLRYELLMRAGQGDREALIVWLAGVLVALRRT